MFEASESLQQVEGTKKKKSTSFHQYSWNSEVSAWSVDPIRQLILIILCEIVSDLCPHIFDTYFLAKSWNGLYDFAKKHLPAVGIIMPLFCICCKIFKYDSSRSFRLPIELFYCLAWVYTFQAAVWFMVNIVGSFDILFRFFSYFYDFHNCMVI